LIPGLVIIRPGVVAAVLALTMSDQIYKTATLQKQEA